jgi:hypothetical protein
MTSSFLLDKEEKQSLLASIPLSAISQYMSLRLKKRTEGSSPIIDRWIDF